MNTATHKVLTPNYVVPETSEVAGVVNPNATRYGWSPFKSINLVGALGTMDYYIQPEGSPYHREIAKNELIPFETFEILSYEPNPNVKALPDKPVPLLANVKTKTAHEAATELLRPYGVIGYTVLNALEGLDQTDAFRIFSVVMPFDYKLGELEGELSFGADERIEAKGAIEFIIGKDAEGEDILHSIAPLRNENERTIARNLAAEMLVAAKLAADFAQTRLSDLNVEISASLGGKPGKTSADNLDKYCAKELMEEVPSFNKKDSAIGDKLDYLIDSEKARRDKEELEELRAYKAAQEAKAEEKTVFTIGETVIADSRTGRVSAKPGGRITVDFGQGVKQTFPAAEVAKVE